MRLARRERERVLNTVSSFFSSISLKMHQSGTIYLYFCCTFHLQEVIEKVKTSGRIKTTLASHFFFKEPARRGRGRSGGGRGGFEGGRGGFDRGDDGGGRRFQDGGRGSGGRGQGGGGGGGRRFNRRDRAPNVEDERDFPSLGGQSAVEVM